jgi:hypothetical protein
VNYVDVLALVTRMFEKYCVSKVSPIQEETLLTDFYTHDREDLSDALISICYQLNVYPLLSHMERLKTVRDTAIFFKACDDSRSSGSNYKVRT